MIIASGVSVGAGSAIISRIIDRINDEDDNEYIFYHGTDSVSWLYLVNRGNISVNSLCNWSASCGGFYLADDLGDATHFANFVQGSQRVNPAVVKYTFSPFAYRTISGISNFEPIPFTDGYNPFGNQLIVPVTGFPTFNQLMSSDEITPSPAGL